LAGLEVATRRGLLRRGNRFLANVVLAKFEHTRATLGAGAQRLLSAEVHDFPGGGWIVVAEIELQLPILVFVAVLQHDLGRERPAGLGTKAFERADLLV